MAVIPVSHLDLTRKRRELKQLMETGQWEKLLQVESELCAQIDSAAQDPQRSTKSLLIELGSVIRVYRELTDLCNAYGQQGNQQRS